jgi:hypothetical protein
MWHSTHPAIAGVEKQRKQTKSKIKESYYAYSTS